MKTYLNSGMFEKRTAEKALVQSRQAPLPTTVMIDARSLGELFEQIHSK